MADGKRNFNQRLGILVLAERVPMATDAWLPLPLRGWLEKCLRFYPPVPLLGRRRRAGCQRGASTITTCRPSKRGSCSTLANFNVSSLTRLRS
jgi:hypothetical protein